MAALDAAATSSAWSKPPETLGEFVSAYSDIVPVFRCANLNAGSVASATLRFYKRLGKGKREELPDEHELVRIFRRPNPRMSTSRWVFATQLSKELAGAAYNEVVVKPAKQLWPLNAAKMKPKLEKRRGVVGYEYHVGHPPEKFKAEEIWEDGFFNPSSEIHGLAPMMPARQHVVAGTLLEQGMLSILKNGMRLSGVMHLDGSATTVQVNALLAQIKEMVSGVRNWGKTLVAAGGRQFQPMGMTPEAIQADSLREWNTGNIMKAFGVWPIVFGQIDTSATRENATTQLLMYHWYTVIPRAKSLAEEMSSRLIPMLGIKNTGNVYAEFDFSDSPIAKQLALEDALASSALVDRGIETINEIRAMLGFDPVAWGDSFWGSSTLREIASVDGGIAQVVASLRAGAGLPADNSMDPFLTSFARTENEVERLQLLLREVARESRRYAALMADSAEETAA